MMIIFVILAAIISIATFIMSFNMRTFANEIKDFSKKIDKLNNYSENIISRNKEISDELNKISHGCATCFSDQFAFFKIIAEKIEKLEEKKMTLGNRKKRTEEQRAFLSSKAKERYAKRKAEATREPQPYLEIRSYEPALKENS